jgi:hypothetical protein
MKANGWLASRRSVSMLASALLVATIITGASVASPANAVVVGVCTIKANNPHPSTHFNGTINSTGTVSCTVVMQEIYLAVYLEKSNGSTWSSYPFYDVFNTSSASENASTLCSQGPGTFRTRVSYVLRAPVGYSPAYTANTIYSPWMGVACGASFVANGGAAVGSSDVTTFQVEFGQNASPTH